MANRISTQQAQVATLLEPFWLDSPNPQDSHGASAPPTSARNSPDSTHTPDSRHWLAPAVGPEAGFRIKVKMAVAGTANEPTLGIVDSHGYGVDLRDCPLYPEPIHRVIQALPAFIKRAQLPPYNVAKRKGQLKHVIATVGDSGRVMLRFVLSSEAPLGRVREHLPRLIDACGNLHSVSANINPVHTSIIEGDEEIHLHGATWLPVTQGRVQLRVVPRSFVQTNTVVASTLYEQVSAWIDDIASARQSPVPLRVWDLFCGVGGFALHAAVTDGSREVTGVELAPAAVRAARETAGEAGLGAVFVCADAARWVTEQTQVPDVLVVNPPRRGMGAQMSQWVDGSGAEHVIYSSCNPRTLAEDLAQMPHYRVALARFVDMFPHTAHAEVVARLTRIDTAGA